MSPVYRLFSFRSHDPYSEFAQPTRYLTIQKSKIEHFIRKLPPCKLCCDNNAYLQYSWILYLRNMLISIDYMFEHYIWNYLIWVYTNKNNSESIAIEQILCNMYSAPSGYDDSVIRFDHRTVWKAGDVFLPLPYNIFWHTISANIVLKIKFGSWCAD